MIDRDFDKSKSHHKGNKSALFPLLYLFIGLGFLFSGGVPAASKPAQGDDRLAEAQAPLTGRNLDDCAAKLSGFSGGWCEMIASKGHPSISSVWPEDQPRRTRMVTGPKAVLIAWNSAAFDSTRQHLYFFGGGHTDYGGNEVYRFDVGKSQWKRLTDSSPLNYLYIHADYGSRPKKTWRRLCWIPDVRQVPGSSHTYDGLIFSHKSETLFLYSYGAANGSCIEDKEDRYKNSPEVLGTRSVSAGWYEFNPSASESRNGLKPLQWRKVFTYEQFKAANIHRSYPASVELPDGEIAFGSKERMVVYDPTEPDATRLKRYIGHANWGDGLKAYDKKRGLIWSIHKASLLAFDAQTGRNVRVIKQTIPHGKSLAFDRQGKILSWNGGSKIFVFDPDAGDEQWRMIDWGRRGPSTGDQRVYGKWRYIKEKDLFVGLSIHTTGVWVYKHPSHTKLTSFSTESLNNLIKHAKPGDVVVPPPGNYVQGILVNKSLTLNLKNVSLYGVSSSKGIINVKCNGCRVVIEDFYGDGDQAGCQSGNCAGVKAEGKNFSLTLRRAHIKGTVMGVLTDNRGGELIVEDSLIEDTGLNDNSREVAHGFYAGLIDRVVIRNSTIRRPFGNGHVFKSRAPDTRIEHSVLAGMDGRHSRIVDFPCGGNLSITNSVLQQGDQTDNIDVISVGTEPKHCRGGVRPSTVTLRNNWIILDRDRSSDERSAEHGKSRLFTWRAPVTSLDVSANKIVESTGQLLFDGEEQLPDMLSHNQLFRSRQAAGLGIHQIPPLMN